ncbi:hypothetical protein CFN58_08670, partial [Pseudomonas avellanae]
MAAQPPPRVSHDHAFAPFALTLGVSVCVAATSVAAQAIAPETTASSATDAGGQQQDPAPTASFEQWLADFRNV